MATSKQPKQPPFQHPALEVGVAQYPTPLVPNYNDKKGGWGINDQGHIILVEKISIEKGSFTPLPLDGSITYTGRDANKWPSTLYLVAERPTQDGEYCFRFWANDRSLSSQNLWNYGISYQDENPNYPIYTRTYIVPRSQYSTVAIGSTDPVFGGTAIITKQAMAELPEDNPLASRYVQVQRVYETIPGPAVTGVQFDEFFQNNLALSKQIIPAGAATIPTAAWVTAHAYSVGDTIIYNTGSTYQQRAEYYICTTAHTSGTFTTDLVAGKWNLILSYKDEPVDSTKSQRVIVTTPSLPPTRTEYKTGTYTSPLLVFRIDTEWANLSLTGYDIRIKLTPVTRASQSRTTIFKTITSYSYGPPASTGDSGLLSPELKEVAYTGYVINFNIGGALCNRITAPSPYPPAQGIPVGTGAGSATIYEYWDIAATDITADDYQGYIGTYKKISWDSKYWKAGIWEQTEVQVLVV